jgi:uncharacterized RDD family membrane protein YckC
MTNPYAPPRAAVVDVVDPYAPTTPADRGTRLAASMLDGIILSAMVYLPLVIGFMIGAVAAPGTPNDTAQFGPILLVGVVLAIVGLVAWTWLTIKYVKLNGQSIAKKMLGIKVVRTDGSPISLGRLFWLRNFVNGIVSIVPLYGLVDVLFIFGESRQCLHDRIADTIVVKA